MIIWVQIAKITYHDSNKINLAGDLGLDTEDTENPMCMYLFVSLSLSLIFYMFCFLNIFMKFLIFENLVYTQK